MVHTIWKLYKRKTQYILALPKKVFTLRTKYKTIVELLNEFEKYLKGY